MARAPVLGVAVLLSWLFAGSAPAQPGPVATPLTYELVINGESFRVEGNRKVKLQSKAKPGTTYDVAVRVSPSQHLRLKNVELDYDLPAQISSEAGERTRSVRIKHELGFTLTITDLGPAMEAEDRAKVLAALKASIVEFCERRRGQKLKVEQPDAAKFQGKTVPDLEAHFQDLTLFLDPEENIGCTCLAYVLSGPKFTVSCLAEYPDKYSADCLPVIQKILASIRALP
jgi:hypothetical protein